MTDTERKAQSIAVANGAEVSFNHRPITLAHWSLFRTADPLNVHAGACAIKAIQTAQALGNLGIDVDCHYTPGISIDLTWYTQE